MTSAPSHASASVHEVPASNWVRSRTFTSSNAVFCDMVWALLLARTVRCVHTFHITRCSGPTATRPSVESSRSSRARDRRRRAFSFTPAPGGIGAPPSALHGRVRYATPIVSRQNSLQVNPLAGCSWSGGTIKSSRLAMSLRRLRSVLAQPHVLEFLVRVMIRRRHVVLHLRPVHHAPRPPDARDVVHVPEHDLLDLVDELLAFCRIQSPRLAREEVVDPRLARSDADGCLSLNTMVFASGVSMLVIAA